MQHAEHETVLVTGVSGLIGGAVARRLNDMGRNVLGADRVVPPDVPYPVLPHELGDGHRLHEIVATHGVRSIVHAGGASGPMVMRESPAQISEVNIGGLLNVLEVARLYKLRRIVWFSSILAYGPQPRDTFVTEDTVLHPTTVYGATKAAGEALVNAYAAEHGVDAVALRVAGAYGPGRTTNCFVRLLVENALAGRPTHVPDPTIPNRQHLHVEDVVDGVLGALTAQQLSRRCYNIAPGNRLSAVEVAEAVGRSIPGVQLREDKTATNWNTFDMGPLSIAAAERDFAFKPRIGLPEGALTYRKWIERGRS